MSEPIKKAATNLENEESGIVRVPYAAISRPLAAPASEGLSNGFIGEQRLADLLFRRRIRRAGRGMMICDGVMYALHEAVHVVGSEHGFSDPYGLLGTVERVDELVRAGARIGPVIMHLGSTTYQIKRGVVAVANAATDECSLVG